MKPTLLFLSCEHAVNTIPPVYQYLFKQHEALLQTHRAIDVGAMDIMMDLHRVFACDYTHATVSRLLIDCNRSLTHSHCFSEFTKQLPEKEKKQLVDQYYLPYRQQTETNIAHHIAQGYQVLHLSIHSFTPVLQGVTRNASLGLLYDPKRHGEKEVARQWRSILAQQTNYRIRMNYPYKGNGDGFTTYLRKCHPERDYLGLELEMNQSLVENKEELSTLALALSTSLNELLQLL